MHAGIIGWDIGGAHIKVAVLESNDVFSQVLQKPCPLWKGIDHLNKAVAQVLLTVPQRDYLHVLTMTGEIVDLFDHIEQGVAQIILTMQNHLSECGVFVYAGCDGLLPIQQITSQHYKNIASANWLASASLVADKLKEGIFVDIGSTTTDILLLSDYKVQAIGTTDYGRLISAELVYTGIVRTAVMAVAQVADFRGKTMGLMAEYFATMADVYRLTGELNEHHDQSDTADGAEKTIFASAKRLSRMTAYEFSADDLWLWQQFATAIKTQQKYKITQACQQQLSRHISKQPAIFVGAGVGRFLVEQIATDLAHPYIDFADLLHHKQDKSPINISDCAPAAAVAYLARSVNNH